MTKLTRLKSNIDTIEKALAQADPKEFISISLRHSKGTYISTMTYEDWKDYLDSLHDKLNDLVKQ